MDSVSDTALTPLSFLERSARVWPDKVAVVYGARRLTYSELAAEAQRPDEREQRARGHPADAEIDSVAFDVLAHACDLMTLLA